MSDVPVGVLLSGGIDSTAVLATARRCAGGTLATFSIGVEDPDLDEAPEARRTARTFGAEHHELRLDGERAGAWVEDFLGGLDQPSIDGFNTYCVSRLAADHGVKAVLSGLGGDELFGGYPSFSLAPRLAALGRIPRAARLPVGWTTALAGRAARQPRIERLGEFLAGAGRLEDAWLTVRSVFSRRETASLLARARLESAAGANPGLAAEQHGIRWDARSAVSYLELTRYMRNQLLRDADVAGMASGVELRVPFVDPWLLDAVAAIPAGQRFRPGKGLLVDAVGELPTSVTKRPKRGFTLPYERWLAGPWEQLARRVPAGLAPTGSWYRRWALVVLTQWLERNGFDTRW